MGIEAVSKFVANLSVYFSPPKRAEKDEEAWIKGLAHTLREFVPKELERAAQEIIDTRELRYFPLPSECLKACAHARRMLRQRAAAAEQQTKQDKGEPVHEPGTYRWVMLDAAWRDKQHRNGFTLLSDLRGPVAWYKLGPPTAVELRTLREKNRGR